MTSYVGLGHTGHTGHMGSVSGAVQAIKKRIMAGELKTEMAQLEEIFK
jgi:hypothetical protein